MIDIQWCPAQKLASHHAAPPRVVLNRVERLGRNEAANLRVQELLETRHPTPNETWDNDSEFR